MIAASNAGAKSPGVGPRFARDRLTHFGIGRWHARTGFFDGGIQAPLRRGDLVFWRGHVAIMIDGEYMIHAGSQAMAVAIEPLRAAVERMEGTAGPPTSVRRL